MKDEGQDNAASRQQVGDAALDAAANTNADGMARKEDRGDYFVEPPEPSHDAISAGEGEGGGAISSKANSTRPADMPKQAVSNASQPPGPHASTRESVMDTTSNAALRCPEGKSRSRNQSVLLQPAALKRLSIMHSLALDDGGDDIIEEASESKEVEKVPDLQDDAKEIRTSHLPDSGPSKKAPFRPTVMKSPTAFRLSHIREDMASAASMRGRRRPRLCLLKPDGGVRVVWDVVTLILVIYIALITPVRIGFELDTIPGTGMFIWEQFIDVFFLLDILLNFRTGFVRKDGALEMQPRKIGWNYLKTYFLIDLVSSFPIDAFVQSMENLQSAKVLKAGKILKVGRILKLAKLARLLKLPHLLGRFEEDITLSVVHIKLMRILLTTSLIAHLDACGWAFMSRLGDTYYSDSWVQAYGALDDSVASQYVSAMYWAITTMTTVGYGDIAPETDEERLYCLVTMIFGGGFYAYVIATLSSIVTNQDANQRMVTERMENIQTYMRIRKFPKQLARRVRKYYKHYYEMKTALNESTILEDLSPALRSEVVIFLVDQTVMQNPLFQQMSPKSFARLIRILFPLKVEEGEWVCREGEFGEEMFMLVSGKLEVVDAEGSVVAVLSSGAHFGELCALGVTNTRTCGVRALECCEMYALSKTDFFETFADSEPKTIKNMIRVAVAAYEDFDFQNNNMRSTRATKGETSSAMFLKGAGSVPQAERGGGDVVGTLKSGPSSVSLGSIPSAAAAAMGTVGGGLNSSFSSSSPREGYGGKHQYSDPVLTRLAVLEANTAEQLGTLVEAVGRLESLAQTPGARNSARRRSQFAPHQHPQGQARAESLEQRFARMGLRTSTDPQFASRVKVTASDLEEEDSSTFQRIVQRHRRRSQAQRGSTMKSARRRSSLARIRPLGK